MLAYDSGFPTAYDPTLTLASLVIAIGVTTTGYLIAAEARRPAAADIASTPSVGTAACSLQARTPVSPPAAPWWALGIGMMHYTGMAAVIVPGVIEWDTPYVVASVLLGMVLASAGMVANRRLEPRKALWVAPGLLTLAHLLPSLHGDGGGHRHARSDHRRASLRHEHQGMAIAVAGVTMLVMLAAVGAALVNAQAEREVERELRRHNEILQQRDKELEARTPSSRSSMTCSSSTKSSCRLECSWMRLNNMVQGLAMFDPSCGW